MDNEQISITSPPSLIPQKALATISHQTSSPISKLSTLTISDSTNPLYQSILEYAALSESTPRPNHPSSLKQNLVILPEHPFQPDHDHSDNHQQNLNSLLSAYSHAARNSYSSTPICRPATRIRTLQHSTVIPKYKHGLGTTSFFWSPLSHLTGPLLSKERDEQRRRNRRANPSLTPPPPPVNPPNENIDTQPPSGNKAQICLVHLTNGNPVAIGFGSTPNTKPQPLLITAQGSESLLTFVLRIIQLSTQKNFRNNSGTKYNLFRFKSSSRETHWADEGLKRPRPTHSVILPENQLETILTDVENFLHPSMKQWRRKHSLPQRRSYLFYGPPGTGKTSTIRVIASTFGLNCCFLSMSNAEFSNQHLGDALASIPQNSLLVIEDVDALFNEGRNSRASKNLTFSDMLNALDGVKSTQGVVTILTTNFIDRLDSALIRGGRVDRRFFFGNPNETQIVKLFNTFYPNVDHGIATQFASEIFTRPEGHEARSIATLKQLLIQFKDHSAQECVDGIPLFFQSYFPSKEEVVSV